MTEDDVAAMVQLTLQNQASNNNVLTRAHVEIIIEAYEKPDNSNNDNHSHKTKDRKTHSTNTEISDLISRLRSEVARPGLLIDDALIYQAFNPFGNAGLEDFVKGWKGRS